MGNTRGEPDAHAVDMRELGYNDRCEAHVLYITASVGWYISRPSVFRSCGFDHITGSMVDRSHIAHADTAEGIWPFQPAFKAAKRTITKYLRPK